MALSAAESYYRALRAGQSIPAIARAWCRHRAALRALGPLRRRQAWRDALDWAERCGLPRDALRAAVESLAEDFAGPGMARAWAGHLAGLPSAAAAIRAYAERRGSFVDAGVEPERREALAVSLARFGLDPRQAERAVKYYFHPGGGSEHVES